MQNVSGGLTIFIALIFVFQIQSAKAQDYTLSSKPDPRLTEAFGKDQVQFLEQNNPDLIQYYNFYLDNAFTLVQHQPEKIAGIISSCTLLTLINSELNLDKPDMSKGTKSINILKYKYLLSYDKPSSYRIDDSGIVIVFFPAKVITENYNKAKNL